MIDGTPREEVFTGRSMRPRARGLVIWVSLLVGSLVRVTRHSQHTILTEQHLPKVQARALFSQSCDTILTNE